MDFTPGSQVFIVDLVQSKLNCLFQCHTANLFLTSEFTEKGRIHVTCWACLLSSFNQLKSGDTFTVSLTHTSKSPDLTLAKRIAVFSHQLRHQSHIPIESGHDANILVFFFFLKHLHSCLILRVLTTCMVTTPFSCAWRMEVANPLVFS